MSRCTNCGDDDALLFTCGHCDRPFCADHQFPFHACDRFSSGTDEADTATADPENDTEVTAPGASPDPAEVAPVARDAARERRPDREGPAPEPPGRGLPKERNASRSVTDWMAEQTYPGYLAKVGSLSLLFTVSYYAGLAAVIYG